MTKSTKYLVLGAIIGWCVALGPVVTMSALIPMPTWVAFVIGLVLGQIGLVGGALCGVALYQTSSWYEDDR